MVVQVIKGRYTISGSITPRGKIQSNIQNTVLKGLSAYELAVKYGYVGEPEEWLASLKGETGPQGEQGLTGEPGSGIESVEQNDDYTLTLRFDDGTSYTTSPIRGVKGEQGIQGLTGNGIASVELNQDYTLTIRYTDGSSYTTESIRGEKGETGEAGYTPQKGVDYFDGQDGAPGRDGHTPQKGVDYFDGEPGHSPVVTTSKSGSATTVYIDGEPAATILDGATGEKGEAGENGNGISSVILNQDYTLTINFSNGSSYTTTSIRGATGQKGDDGNGIVSIEKTATVENIDTYTITFTDGTTTTYDVENGAVTSINGQKGAVQIGVDASGDGLVVLEGEGITANSIESVVMNQDYTLTINFSDETSYTTAPIRGLPGADGAKGDPGDDGKSAYDYAVDGGYTGSETDFAQKLATEYVSDIQINGTSIFNSGVANVPIAGSNFGVVKYLDSRGVVLDSNGIMTLAKGTDTQIKEATARELAVMISTQHQSVFYGLAKAAGDTTQSQSSNSVGTYTESAQSAINDMLNAPVSVSGTTPTIVAKSGIQYICGEVTLLDFTPCSSGICDVRFTSGSAATVLTVPSTVKFPDWFDPTSLEQDTVYEINVLDGVYGVVTAWEA